MSLPHVSPRWPPSKSGLCFIAPVLVLVITLYFYCSWKHLDPGSATTTGQCNPLPVCVNKVLLEHSRVHSFTYCLWQLSDYEGWFEPLQQRPTARDLSKCTSKIKILNPLCVYWLQDSIQTQRTITKKALLAWNLGRIDKQMIYRGLTRISLSMKHIAQYSAWRSHVTVSVSFIPTSRPFRICSFTKWADSRCGKGSLCDAKEFCVTTGLTIFVRFT